MLMRSPPPAGPYSSLMPRALWWSWGGERFLVREVPRYPHTASSAAGHAERALVLPLAHPGETQRERERERERVRERERERV